MDGIEGTNEAGKALLVVDDDPLQCLLVRRIAERAGFIVDCAHTASQATQALADRPYTAVALDLSLGREDGLGILHQVAQASNQASPPPQLILITGCHDRIRLATSRLAAALGIAVAGTLRKPIIAKDLLCLLATRASSDRRAPLIRPLTAEHLQSAVRNGEIGLAFQPKISMATQKIVGVEALARWTSPAMGDITPECFIPALEHHGLIEEVTEQLLAQALAACTQWRQRNPGVSVAINVSRLSLNDRTFPDRVEALIDASNLSPGAITLEITESSMVGDDHVVAEVLTRLRIKGYELSIDDFGTGYSSMLSLLRMPFSELKIDRSFVGECDTDQDAWKIVFASLSLAHQFGMIATAEGIEHEAVALRLQDAGCDIAQGWFFGRAMPLPALQTWLAAQ
jgi:EAL domain-containing protein (putative c-di-GMP-specific phosphodiesterase class I)/ActR/RegA family two-component response regulator